MDQGSKDPTVIKAVAEAALAPSAYKRCVLHREAVELIAEVRVAASYQCDRNLDCTFNEEAALVCCSLIKN